MPSTAEKQLVSLEVLGRKLIEPAIIGARSPLAIEAFQCIEPVSWQKAAKAAYQPVRLGWQWGPKWSTCWFRLSGRPPAGGKGKIWLRFSTDTEAQLWIGGVPRQGFDVNRDLAELPGSATKSGRARLFVEAACNHPFGADGLQWDSPETCRRWAGPTPGRLIAAELVRVNETVTSLWHAWQLCASLARELLVPPPPNVTFSTKFPENLPWQDGRCEELLAALRQAASLLDRSGPERLAESAPRALRVLEACLNRVPGASTSVCHAVGHAHIDTAWLWPLRETRRKCLRTFSNVLRLMERHPQFRFLCSQAQQYAYVEQDSPELFAQIARRVAQGRWEPGGAMWIEPDCCVPGAESLIRQVLHGTRYWASRFGPRAGRQRYLYLPDTFGFPAHLPQVMRHTGIDTFITNKISWNDTNPFPHTTFTWRGNDGSEVLTHFTPGNDYNATNSPRELRRGQTNHRTKQIPSQGPAGQSGARWLQPYGFGDGGGGPTDWMIESATNAACCDGLPAVRHSRVDDFCRDLRRDIESADRKGVQLPAWQGELYLELHRGTLTTQAWLKRAMREAEDDLRLAEALSVIRFAGRPKEKPKKPGRELQTLGAELDAAWKTVLLNQFHDILPGSSIGWVYDDARAQMEQVRDTVQGQIQKHIRELRTRVAARAGERADVLIVNPASTPRVSVVELGERLGMVWAMPLSVRAGDATDESDVPESERVDLSVDSDRNVATLRNHLLSATIDRFGRVLKLSGTGGTQVVGDQPLNSLVLMEDHPRMWEAWDFDESALDPSRGGHQPQLQEPDEWSVAERSPLRASIRISRRLGTASRIVQTFVLDAQSPRLDIRTSIHWLEGHRLLRASFPTRVRADCATFDTGGGTVQRPTHRNTTWEQAAFEVPAHRWVDLSEPGARRGLGVLNDCKYGHSCVGRTIGLTLLRSPRYPDPKADLGDHEFIYSLMPHAGDWRGAGVAAEAEALHRPLIVIPQNARSGSPARATAALMPVSVAGQAMTIWALKFGEPDGASRGSVGKTVVLRLQEQHGASGRCEVYWDLPVKSVLPVDGLEQRGVLDGFRHDRPARRSTFHVGPYQIVSLAAKL